MGLVIATGPFFYSPPLEVSSVLCNSISRMDQEKQDALTANYINLFAAVIRRARVDCGEFGLAQCLKTEEDDVCDAKEFLEWAREQLNV